MTAVILVLAFLLILAVGAVAASVNRMRQLQAKVAKAESSIERTSRLLIEKNIELFDQNVNQQKLLAVKDDFIAIASHQLRTPLNEIKWGIGELIEKAEGPALKHSYEQIFSSAARMQRIVEDLLRFVQVEQGHTRVAVAPYDPNAIVRTVAERVAKDFPQSGITPTLTLSYAEILSSTDSATLEMIVANLVENAYHYTPASGTIAISTSVSGTGAFVFEIQDTGIGIPADMAQRVFDKFRRAPEAVERNKEGSGLGLYIVKTLLDRAGGTVTFHSEVGKGSLFHVEIPKVRGASTSA